MHREASAEAITLKEQINGAIEEGEEVDWAGKCRQKGIVPTPPGLYTMWLCEPLCIGKQRPDIVGATLAVALEIALHGFSVCLWS